MTTNVGHGQGSTGDNDSQHQVSTAHRPSPPQKPVLGDPGNTHHPPSPNPHDDVDPLRKQGKSALAIFSPTFFAFPTNGHGDGKNRHTSDRRINTEREVHLFFFVPGGMGMGRVARQLSRYKLNGQLTVESATLYWGEICATGTHPKCASRPLGRCSVFFFPSFLFFLVA